MSKWAEAELDRMRTAANWEQMKAAVLAITVSFAVTYDLDARQVNQFEQLMFRPENYMGNYRRPEIGSHALAVRAQSALLEVMKPCPPSDPPRRFGVHVDLSSGVKR